MLPRLFLAAIFLGVPGLVGIGAPIKVACIGDSITEGTGLSNPALESYPAKLHRLLGRCVSIGSGSLDPPRNLV